MLGGDGRPSPGSANVVGEVGRGRRLGHAALRKQRAWRVVGEQGCSAAEHDGCEVDCQRVERAGGEGGADDRPAAHEDDVEILAAR